MPYQVSEVMATITRFFEEILSACPSSEIDIDAHVKIGGQRKRFHLFVPFLQQSLQVLKQVQTVVQDEDDWSPDDYQCAVLAALEYRAFHSEPLILELEKFGQKKDRTRFWKKGNGIKELMARGLVKLDPGKKGIGYYRPDAPPDELPNSSD